MGGQSSHAGLDAGELPAELAPSGVKVGRHRVELGAELGPGGLGGPELPGQGVGPGRVVLPGELGPGGPEVGHLAGEQVHRYARGQDHAEPGDQLAGPQGTYRA
jgi:hypothetical protein